jgi:hypothetical protein
MNIDTSDNTTNEPFPKDHATASNNMVGLPATAKANKEPGASSAKAVGTNTTPNENQATTDDSQSAMERGGIDGSINDEDHHNKSIIVTNDEHKNDPEDRDGAVIDDTTSSQKEPIMSATQTLRTLWKVVHNDHQHTDGNSSNLHPSILQAVHDTVSVLLQAYDAILQPAVRAMMELERVQKELQATKRALQGKNREMERLKESEQQSKRAIAVRVCVCVCVSFGVFFFPFRQRLSLSVFFISLFQNLLKAVETSNEESRDNAQTKLVQAKLRAEILHATQQRDEASQKADEYSHRIELLQNDLQHYKTKSHRLQTDKAQVERDLCTVRGMLTNMQGNVSNDVDYYKRKVR